MKKKRLLSDIVFNSQFGDETISVDAIKYEDGRNSLIAMCKEEDFGGMEVPYATCSIAYLGDPKENEIAIKAYSENTGILEFLMKHGIVSKPIRFIPSGFVQIPICKMLYTFDDND
jgi:hypothetical protein